MSSFIRFAAFGASVALAESASKLDVTTFSKLVRKQEQGGKKDTMIVHFKKKYGYDSAEISEKVTLATQTASQVMVFDLELPDKLMEADEEPSSEGEESESSEDSGADWKVKEKKEKDLARAIVEKHEIEVSKMPYIAVYKGGKVTASYDVGEEGKAEEVMSWLEARGVPLVLETDSDIALFDEILTKFAAPGAKAADFQALLPDMKSLIDDEFSLDDEKKAKAGAFSKALTNAAKQADGAAVLAYCTKEASRLQSIVDSGAVSSDKKKDMSAKMAMLKALAGKLAPKEASAEGDEL